MSAAQQNNLKYDQVATGRCSDRVPTLAPYNFGISREWFDEHRNKTGYRTLLKDWNNFPEPEGCGLPSWAPGENVVVDDHDE